MDREETFESTDNDWHEPQLNHEYIPVRVQK